MSQPNTKLPFTKRKEVLRENVGKISYTAIAEKCGVDRRTLYRDIEKLKKQGVWFQWIEDRFTDLLADNDIEPAKKLVELGKLYGKQFTEKHQIKAEVDLVTETRQVIDWSKLNDAERSKLIDAGRILIRKRRSEEKPSSVH